MIWLIVTFIISTLYLLGWVFAPFPYWPTYFLLWKHVLLNPERAIPWRARMIQARFLLRYLLTCPLWTFLWHLDEVLYPTYKQGSHRSIFIIGQPRSGTTFLHRTMAADEETFCAVRHIEWRYPFISLQKLFQWLRVEEYFKNQDYWPDTEVGRQAAKMHHNTLYDWEEDAIFFEECFLHHLFIWFRMPFNTLIKYLDDFSLLPEETQHRMMQTYQKVVLKVMYLRGENKIFLSKEVAGQRKLPRILEYYPDAVFLLNTRESIVYLNSILELVKFSTAVKTGIDPVSIPNWEATFVQRMREDTHILLDFLNQIEPEKKLSLSSEFVLHHTVASIQTVYTQLDLPMSQTYCQYLELVQHEQANRDRGYDYEIQPYPGFEEYDAFVDETARNHYQLISRSFVVEVTDMPISQRAAIHPIDIQKDT